MGGIGLGLNTTSTEHHTHIRTYIRNYTPANIYMHREQKIQQYAAHNPHTERTQFAHIYAHTQTQNTAQGTQNKHNIRTQNNLSTEQHTCTHSYSHI